MVRIGKARMPAPPPPARDHYQMLPPGITITTDMKPIDYIGLYLIVIASSCITVNWLFRIYF